ncbi:MAG: hypothetical protein U0414_04910 [Polyangiaceae bacterium]
MNPPRALVVGLLSGALVSACVPEGKRAPQQTDKEPAAPIFTDDFERKSLGADYFATTDVWKIDGGRVCATNAQNHPLWLKRKIPVNARVEVDAVALSPEGDLKIEVWGDGKSFAEGTSYSDATSYLFIFGGWKNTLHVLARLDEHDGERLEIPIVAGSEDEHAQPVQPGQTYHFTVERRNSSTVSFSVNGARYFEYADEQPLSGIGHDHLAFNEWSAPVCFDNLTVTPL